MQEHGRHTTIVEIQHLRMVAVLLVVLAHIHQADARFFTTTLFDQTAYFGFAGVDVFFVLSGFIIHHLYRDYRGLDVRYFLKRLNRIFPLYWIFTGLTLAGYLVFAGSLTRSFAELDLIASLTLFPHHDLPILLVGWTLTHELYFYALFGLALALPPAWRVRAAALWAAATIAATALMPRDVSPWLAVAFSPFNLLFLSGIALSVLRDRLPARRWPLTVVALAGMIGGLVWTHGGGLEAIDAAALRVPVFAPFAIGITAAWLAWKPHPPALAARIGDWSYAIYLGHLLAISALARLLPESLWSPLFYLLALAACITLGWLTHIAVEMPLLKAGRRLIDKIKPPADTQRAAKD